MDRRGEGGGGVCRFVCSFSFLVVCLSARLGFISGLASIVTFLSLRWFICFFVSLCRPDPETSLGRASATRYAQRRPRRFQQHGTEDLASFAGRLAHNWGPRRAGNYPRLKLGQARSFSFYLFAITRPECGCNCVNRKWK